jgi:hypothetical protein
MVEQPARFGVERGNDPLDQGGPMLGRAGLRDHGR